MCKQHLINQITQSFRRSLLLLGTLLLVSSFSTAQTDSNESLFSQLEQLEKLQVVIETDLSMITGERNVDDYQTAKISVYDGKRLHSDWDIEVKQRGRFRRKVCNFPPLKLNFDKKQLKAEGLAKFDKFKLVTHCLDDKFDSSENVMREYLAYEFYNMLTPNSYRAILTKVTYIDSSNPKNKIERAGILIEPTSELADRMGAKEDETLVNPPIESLDVQNANMVSVYQYMIGNEDWSIEMMRNLKPFLHKSSGKYILVPYDFDFSGLVNASYALPSADLGLKSVTQRAYIGFPASALTLEINKQKFLSSKDKMLNLIKSTKKLPFAAKLEMEAYLTEFFKEIDRLPVPMLQISGKEKSDTTSGVGIK